MSPLLEQLSRRVSEVNPERIDGAYPEAAVAVMITREPEPKLLLTERAGHLRLHSGEVAFPGGKRDPEDTDLLATALREMEEEVGIAGHQVEPIGELSERVTITEIKVTPWVGVIEPDLPLVINRDELDSAFYVPLRHFMQRDNLFIHSREYRGATRYFAQYEYSDYRIWGATARIIVDMMNLAFDTGFRIDASQVRDR